MFTVKFTSLQKSLRGGHYTWLSFFQFDTKAEAEEHGSVWNRPMKNSVVKSWEVVKCS